MTELRRRFLVSLVLAVVAVVSVAVTYRKLVLFDRASDEQDLGARMSMALQDERVWALTLTRKNKSISLKREPQVGGTWTVNTPKGAGVNQNVIAAAIDALGHMRFLRQIKYEARELSEVSMRLGLEKPRFEWHIKTADDQWTVRFGSHPPDVKMATYVQIGGKSPALSMFFVVVAQEPLLDIDLENIATEAHAWNGEDIESIEIASASTHTIVRALHDVHTHKWRDATSGIRLDRLQIEAILAEVAHAARGKTRSRLRDAAVPDVVLTLRIGRKSAATTVIEIRAGCDGSSSLAELQFSNAPDELSCAPLAPLTEAALRPPHAWHDLGLFSLELDEVESARTTVSTGVFSIERDEISFSAAGTGGQRVSLETGNDMLRALCSLRGHTLVHSDRAAFQEHASISLRTSVVGDGFQETILVGGLDADGWLQVFRVEDSVILRMNPEAADLLRTQMSRLTTVARAQ